MDTIEVIEKLSNIESMLLTLTQAPSQKPDHADTDEFLTYREVCKLTKLKYQTVCNLKSLGKIPFVENGHRVRFLKSEILAWIRSGKNRNSEEVTAKVDTFLKNKRAISCSQSSTKKKA